MDDPLLIDTDVLIDYLRGRSSAVSYLESLPEPPYLSAVTVAELYAGVREGGERDKLDELISALKVVPLDREISIRGGLYRRDYKASHNVGLIDALIAATAESVGARRVTLNRKHFPMLANVIVPYGKP
jgi:predicted nucleic acid-binding protein